ncbi:MAG TPA: aldehyde dehydrogenase family protein [Myxococcales bacterium]|nr:aldehyde dehydrogenase family protein [Myxococcales bacterium]
MLPPDQIERLVEKVVEKLRSASAVPAEAPRAPAYARGNAPGVFDDLDQAVAAAGRAFEKWGDVDLETRAKCIAAIRKVCLDRVEEIAQKAVAETGLGRVAHKTLKNRVAIVKTPGLEILETKAFTGDDGLTLHERAPFGTLLSITPSTNPTETIINNAISMIAGGNSVVFNVHPGAKSISRTVIGWINEAIVANGGPQDLVACIAEPTIESAQALMKHAGIKVVVVTGGGAVVKQAMASGKRAICAGPGNPPVLVDETADLQQAGRDVVLGAGMDNNIICIVEKELFVVRSVADALKREMVRNGAWEVNGPELSRLEKLLVTHDGHVNRDFIGKDARKIAEAAGIRVEGDPPILLAEVDASHPFVQLEMLLPVLGMVRVQDVGVGIREAVKAEHGYFHTAVMHSKSIDNLHDMARAVNTSLFVKNAPSYAGLGVGGEGYTAWTIAGSSGDGLTTARTYTRERRCTLKDKFRIV